MNFRDDAAAVSAMQQLLKTLELKGYELKGGTENPLSPKNDRVFSAYLHEYHTDDQGITDVSFDILWKLLLAKKHDLEWVRPPKGVQGNVENTRKANLPLYTPPRDNSGEEQRTKGNYQLWAEAIEISKQEHSNDPRTSRQRQAAIRAKIHGYRERPNDAQQCLAEIRDLQRSWGDR